MKPFSLFYALISPIGFCLFSCNSDSSETPETQIVSQSFHTGEPSSSMIRIVNSGKTSSVFSLNVNNLIFSNAKELELHLTNTGDSTEPIEKRAWRYVKNQVYFEQPLTDSNWVHDPGIFINSLGFGYCDDKASVLAFIWDKIGLFSRVWSLGGHVVPEVYANDGWSMYDPEYEVYYQTSLNFVNGVMDLTNQPSIIRFGYLDKMSCNNIHAMWNRYSYKTAKAYLTMEDNFVSDWYSQPVEEYNLEITIPPDGKFEFPGKFESHLLNSKSDTIYSFANARLTIPKEWSGKIDIPLVIHSIKGQGVVIINSKEYEIGAAPIKSLINNRTEFVYDLEFKLISKTVEIIYLVNPLIFGLSKENLIVTKGINTKSLDFSIVKLGQSELINFPKRFNFPKEVYNVERYMNQLVKLSKLKIKARGDIYKKLLFIITANSNLKQEEMEKRYRFFYNKIEEIFSSVNQDVNSNELVKALNDDIYFAVFISLVEHLDTEEIISIINDSSNLNVHGKIHKGGV